MQASENQPTDLSNPKNPILDCHGLAALLGISVLSIPTQRSRSPHKLPPPYLTRPLRWRRTTVVLWMEKQERAEQDKAVALARATEILPPRRRAARKVSRVCRRSDALGRGIMLFSRCLAVPIFSARTSGYHMALSPRFLPGPEAFMGIAAAPGNSPRCPARFTAAQEISSKTPARRRRFRQRQSNQIDSARTPDSAGGDT